MTKKRVSHYKCTLPSGSTKQKYIRALCWNQKKAEVKLVATLVGPSQTYDSVKVGDVQMLQNYNHWLLGRVVRIERAQSMDDLLSKFPFKNIVPFAQQTEDVVAEFNTFYGASTTKTSVFVVLFFFILEFKLGVEYPQSLVCGQCRVPRCVAKVVKTDDIPENKKCICGNWICNDCLDLHKPPRCVRCM